MLVVAPNPHLSARESASKLSLACSSRNSRFENGPNGEQILRSGSLPTTASLTSRAINQGFVALSSLFVCLRFRRRIKPDLIIGTVPAIPTAAVTYLVARVLGCRYVIDLRDSWPDLLEYSDLWNRDVGSPSVRERILQRGPFQVAKMITATALRGIYYKSAAMITTADRLRIQLEGELRSSMKEHRPALFTIRNVFPPETQYRKSDRAALNDDQLNVLYAGTLGRAQQLSNAIEAVKIAHREGYKINLRMVGAGAASPMLRKEAKNSGLPIVIYGRVGAGEMADHYEWADTALVHLADWEPLRSTVPSKAFELIQMGIHISGVVAGETADIIRDLKVGDVVPPNNPEELSRMWSEMIEDRSKLVVGKKGQDSIKTERDALVPETLNELLKAIH